MKLHSYFRSTSAWRVRIVLAHKGIPFEYVAVDLSPGVTEQESPGYGLVNPFRQVPTLEWEEGGKVLRLSQSVAIVEYLEERIREPPLLPREPLARARVRAAVEVVNSGIQPFQNSRTLATVRELTDEEHVRRWPRGFIARGLAALEASAAEHGGAFSVGNDVTLADVYLVPQLASARRFEVDLSPYPRLVDIEARAGALPAFRSAHPDRQPDAPREGAFR